MAGKPEAFVEFWLQQYTKAGDRHLDVGCGPCYYRDSTPADYIGIDVSAENADGTPRPIDILGSGQALPFPNDCMDLLTSKSAFFLFPDPIAALGEFCRVLKPGGRLILFDYNRRTQRHLAQKEREYGNDCNYPCWSQWELKQIVADAGFVDCDLLINRPGQITGIEKQLRLLYMEWRASWAIVTGLKPTG